MTKEKSSRPAPRRKLPRSFKDLTLAKHFNPRTFFQELILKGWFTPRHGQPRRPVFPKLKHGEVAITWIGHASFLIQFTDLNVLIDPNFANWLFLLKRIKRAGLKIKDLPPIDLVLLTHAHFDHFHKPTLRKLPHPKIGIMPRGVGDLAHNLGFSRVIELEHWESFSQGDWKVTFTPSKHWGARTLHDESSRLRRICSGASGKKNLSRGRQRVFSRLQGDRQEICAEIALLPIGAYHPESFRRVHMGPDEAIQGVQGFGREIFCADALRDFQTVVRGNGRAAALAPGNRREGKSDGTNKNSRRRRADGVLIRAQ